MNYLSRQRDTPTRSPFAKSPNPRSPTKISRQELGLSLQQVIGTTCNSVNCFDVHAQSRSFVYTAGAAAVLATVDEQRNVSQRFFRATAASASSKNGNVSEALLSPHAQQDLRNQAFSRSRDSASPFATSAGEGSDSPSSKSGHAKDRVKAATAVAISPNGKYLAVGETGYKPRVLVFPITPNHLTDTPLSVISEHSYGIQAVAFSPDSRLLATLGTVNDGFVNIWDVDERTGTTILIASNKCTNVVKQITWIGRALVAVGLRFIKVWRPDDSFSMSQTAGNQMCVLSSPAHRPLEGRNTLLEDLLEATFTCIVPLSHSQAVVCSNKGDICILDDSEKQQRMIPTGKTTFGITSVCSLSEGQLLVAGLNGQVERLAIHDMSWPMIAESRRSSISSRSDGQQIDKACLALGCSADFLVTVEYDRSVKLRSLPPDTTSDIQDVQPFYELSGHAGAVAGVRSLKRIDGQHHSSFATWSHGGTVKLWGSDGQVTHSKQVPLDQANDMYNVVNELKTATISGNGTTVVTGDKYGVLRMLDIATDTTLYAARAHAAEITDIAVHRSDKCSLVATSSRDRTVQVFACKPGSLELLQTLDEHAGAVTSVLFTADGSQLLSCSADRTVVVRHAISVDDGGPRLFAISRTINLKSAPTCFKQALYDNTIVVSTADRMVQFYDTSTGRLRNSFKATDSDGSDAVVISSLVHLPSASGGPIIAGVSSTDKSVRLYADDGTLLARDWGHTEGITDIALIQIDDEANKVGHAYNLVTVAADGTIFVWNTVPGKNSLTEVLGRLSITETNGTQSPLMQQPLRKVISHTELARLQRSQVTDENQPMSPGTPTAGKPPMLRKKLSRLTINQAPRLNPVKTHLRNGSVDQLGSPKPRHRSPSPHNRNLPTHTSSYKGRRRSATGGAADKPSQNTPNHSMKGVRVDSAADAPTTERLCALLGEWRHRSESSGSLKVDDGLRAIEKELELCLEAVRGTLSAAEQASQKALSKVEPQIEIKDRCPVLASHNDQSCLEGKQDITRPETEAVGGADVGA